MPITTRNLDTRDVRKGGKRIYIVKDHDQAVVRTVPVGVCAAPPRVALQAPAGGEPGPTCPAPLPADLVGRHGLAGLSMGMSADYESAAMIGATHVRVGTALFGERNEGG